MSISTVGAALKFAMNLEANEVSAWESTAESFPDDQSKKICRRLADDSRKRLVLLKSIYEDYTFSDMDAGILAPIEAIDGSSYIFEDKAANSGDVSPIHNFQRTNRFYSEFFENLGSDSRSLRRRIEKVIRHRAESASALDPVGRP